MQIFAHELPFSHIRIYRVPEMVSNGGRPPRPPNREILGLSEDVWMLVEKCWDGSPTARPPTADVLSFFEAASSRWVSPNPEAIADLGLDRLIATHEPSTREPTFTSSEAVPRTTGPEAGCCEPPQSLAITTNVQRSTVSFHVSLPSFAPF